VRRKRILSDQIPDPALYLAGPTASGKTGVAVALAHRIGGAEIVNADAYQVYRGLEILTATPTIEERGEIPHHLFGVLDLSEECDAASVAKRARQAISEVSERGKVPIVVGGGGLYLKALTHGLADTPPGDPDLRAELEKLSLEELVAWLEAVDPEGASATNLKNRRYVTRNLEITLLTGRPASEIKRSFEEDAPEIRAVYLARDREELYERINRRTELMIEQGVIDEVRGLDHQEISGTAAKAIGLGEIRSLLAGEISEADCVAVIQQATRRYAKRQSTWFRREKAFQTVCVGVDETSESVADRILVMFPKLNAR